MMTGRQLCDRLKDGRIPPSEFLEIVKEELAKQNSVITLAKAVNIKDAKEIELEIIKLEYTKV
jgi:hypothetical protein